jgi:hypothetical protein
MITEKDLHICRKENNSPTLNRLLMREDLTQRTLPRDQLINLVIPQTPSRKLWLDNTPKRNQFTIIQSQLDQRLKLLSNKTDLFQLRETLNQVKPQFKDQSSPSKDKWFNNSNQSNTLLNQCPSRDQCNKLHNKCSKILLLNQFTLQSQSTLLSHRPHSTQPNKHKWSLHNKLPQEDMLQHPFSKSNSANQWPPNPQSVERETP